MIRILNIFRKKNMESKKQKYHSVVVKCKLTGEKCTELDIENCRYCYTYIRIHNRIFYNKTEKELYKKYLLEKYTKESR